MATAESSSGNGHSKKNIVVGTLLGYVSLALSVVSTLIFTPLIKDALGTSDYGLFTLASSLINVIVMDFGLSMTTNVFLAKMRADGKSDQINHFLGIIYKIYLLIDFVLLIAFVSFYFLIDKIYVGLTSSEIERLKVIYIISASFSIVSFPFTTLNGVLLAYEEFIWSKIIDVIHKILYIIFCSLVIYLNLGLYYLVLGQAIDGIFCLIIKLFVVQKKTKTCPSFSEKTSKKEVFDILGYSIWAAVLAACERLIFVIVPSILGIVSNSTEIAVFGVISTLDTCVYLLSSVLSGFFMPTLSRIFAGPKENQKIQIQSLSYKIGKMQFFLMALISIGFACCGKEFLAFWMKDEIYQEAFFGFLLVISYDLLSVPELIFRTAMYSTFHHKDLALSMMVTAGLNVGLCFLLGYFFGCFGACFSIFLSRFICFLIDNFFYKKDLNVDLIPFFKKVFAPFLIPSVLALSSGLILHFFLPFGNGVKFLIIGFTVVLTFSLSCFFLSFSKEERLSIKRLFKK